ncbi:MAG: squalene/phytoene synthase family protein [Hyphomicrobiales bacterium]|nr:squalene/phytoene synthase family protein [Hyphomicrobiales bacterium]
MAQSKQQAIIWQSVRSHDLDRYLATLFAPAHARDPLMALYAFNIDVSRIPGAVSEPMLGEVRLQWWRDALEVLEKGDVTGNPVADALGKAIHDFNLPKPLLQGVIDARAFDLSGEAMPDGQALKAYLQKTQGALFTLAARIVTGEKPDRALEAIAQQAGFAWGLTDMLRMLPVHLSRGRFYLPVSHFRDCDADPNVLLSGTADEMAQKALLGLQGEAREALGQTCASLPAHARKTGVAFLPCALVPPYLSVLEKQAGTPLERVAEINPLRRLSFLTWGALRGRLG